MTQTTPLENGTKVLYSAFYYDGTKSSQLDHEATVKGFTYLKDDDLHYVLEGPNESGDLLLFIRAHGDVKVNTTLAEYVTTYMEEERHRKALNTWDDIKRWATDAIAAYEAGAR